MISISLFFHFFLLGLLSRLLLLLDVLSLCRFAIVLHLDPEGNRRGLGLAVGLVLGNASIGQEGLLVELSFSS
jgi:hypothetical protein